jgi:ribosomal protein L22
MKTSTAKSIGRVSFKESMILCDAISRKKVSSAKSLLSGMLDGSRNLEGKFYPKTAEKVLEVLKAAEANAKQKNFDAEKLFVKVAKADKSFKYVRPKSRFKFRGREAKIANLEIVVEER